jgi:hypothetical protein
VRALEADDLAAVIAEYFQRLSKERERSVAAPGTLKRRMTEINKKTAKLADLLTKTTDSSGVYCGKSNRWRRSATALGSSWRRWNRKGTAMKVCADITPDTVRRLLRTILTELNDYPERLRDEIHQLIDRVELSPETFDAVPKYSISPLV